MHQAVHFIQNSVLCSWPSHQHIKQMHCCGGARLCGQKKLYSVAKMGAPATSYVTFQPRSINPTPEGRGQWHTELNDGVQGSACAQAFNSTLTSCKYTSLPGDSRRQAKAKDRANWQSEVHLTPICLWLISPSLLEHFSDSNSEISVLSASFPRCWEQIARFLSHYLLPAFHRVTSHPFKHTSSTRATSPPPRLIYKPTAM